MEHARKDDARSPSLFPARFDKPFLSLRDAMNRLFDESFWDPFESSAFPARSLALPKVDIAESDAAIEIRADLPGINPKDVDIEVEKDSITIRGVREKKSEEKGKSFYRAEREYGEFRRSFALPAPVDPDKVSATMKDGVLTISLPKLEKTEKRKVEVKSD